MSFFTGDDWELTITIRKNGVAFDASSGTINAAVVQVIGGRPTTIIAATAQSEVATGADWANGVIIVEFASAATGTVNVYDNLFIELQVDKGGKKTTWPLQKITVQEGTIS